MFLVHQLLHLLLIMFNELLYGYKIFKKLKLNFCTSRNELDTLNDFSLSWKWFDFAGDVRFHIVNFIQLVSYTYNEYDGTYWLKSRRAVDRVPTLFRWLVAS